MSNSKRALALSKSQFHEKIRCFFNDNNYVETQTPILSDTLIPESSIEVFETTIIRSDGERQAIFLTPSPEIYMKMLIHEGIGDCYQLTPSFRNCEDQSNRHANEFTMLEWYSIDRDYHHSIEITQALLRQLAKLASPESRACFEHFAVITMAQLFNDYVAIDLSTCVSLNDFKKTAERAGFEEYAAKATTWEELFHFIFIAHVEPMLPKDQSVFVTNYPFQIPTTAKRAENHYERWELYVNGWEIANCYTEEARYEQMLTLFENEEKAKQKMQVPHPVNYEYLNIFKNGTFPHCSGVALGVDRLFAIAVGANSIQDIMLV